MTCANARIQTHNTILLKIFFLISSDNVGIDFFTVARNYYNYYL